MTRITLIRHGETTANVAQLLQGRNDAPLTAQGEAQLAKAAGRIADDALYDLVVSSPQGRALASSAALGFGDPETDADLVEGDPGTWEGLTRSEILAGFPDDVARLAAGEDIAIGGGERRSDLRRRAIGALERIAARVGPEGRALVVTHGGVIGAAAAGVLQVDGGRWPLARVLNTSFTTVEMGPDPRLLAFNDDSHLHEDDRDGYRADRATHIVLMRHGQTEANAAGVWQGRLPGVLDAVGLAQAQDLTGFVPQLDALYASPLQRAIDTAGPLAVERGLEIEIHEDLAEMAMGQWEGLTTAEIQDRDPAIWTALYEKGEDVARGSDGETFGGVAARMRRAIDEIAAANQGRTIGIVSHGAALRAFLGTVLGFGFPGRNVIPSMENTAVSRLVISKRGSALATFNVRP
ncbi:MAG: histidine phosphatase family protein [Acidimicrobiia bacterium]|nr:histidine phosphatase family protein [Acidimicrobiia bacterium]